MNTDTLVLLLMFRICLDDIIINYWMILLIVFIVLILLDDIIAWMIFLNYCWMITWVKNLNNFQIAKIQPQGVA